MERLYISNRCIAPFLFERSDISDTSICWIIVFYELSLKGAFMWSDLSKNLQKPYMYNKHLNAEISAYYMYEIMFRQLQKKPLFGIKIFCKNISYIHQWNFLDRKWIEWFVLLHKSIYQTLFEKLSCIKITELKNKTNLKKFNQGLKTKFLNIKD